MTEIEHVDAVVIGASTRGVVAAYVLDMLGFSTILLERGPALGGGDGSFQLADGTWFDFGMHVLDEDRSPLATRLFRHAVDGQCHRVRLRRGVVLRNEIMPYAPEPHEMPAEIGAMLPPAPLIDELGAGAPTRENLSRYYGAAFTDLIFDEVLPSYPTEARHLDFGVDESKLLVNIYPWFFPRARRRGVDGDESRQFHDRLRAGIDQYVLYPRDGGFAQFSRGFAGKLDQSRSEVLTGVGEIEISADTDRHRFERLETSERRFTADYWFWASSWPELCKLLAIPCQNPATDRIALGSFRFDRELESDYHELLVGDPEHPINRIHFPGRFRETRNDLAQVEFAYPDAQPRPADPGHWRDVWLKSLRRLGIADDAHEAVLFDFKTRKLHFNGYGMEGVALVDADPGVLKPGSNVHPVVPSMSNLNLNAHIPRDVAFVTNVVAGVGPGLGSESTPPA